MVKILYYPVLAFPFLLSLCLLSPICVEAASGDGIVEVELSVLGTFLRAMDDWPYAGPGDYDYDENLELDVGVQTDFHVEEPLVVDLQAEGFLEGDTIIISWYGGFYPSGAWNPNNPGSTAWGLSMDKDILNGGLLGLFSTSSQISDIDNLHRVVGAIDYGEDFVTLDSYWSDSRTEIHDKLRAKGVNWEYDGPMKTDIPEDFRISPNTGMEIKIPRNARYLFLCVIDAYYRDNYPGPEGLVVTIEKDTDLDGIPDHWEINGIDIDNDGTTDLDLPMMEADWEHKDIFVEIDYMPTLRPRQEALDAVEAAFANSPILNPDGTTGINLHLIVGEEIPYKEVLSGWGEFYTLKSTYFGSAEERTDTETVNAKKKIFRYCLSVDRIWLDPPDHDCPGLAEGISCDDFIIALGAFTIPSIDKQAALFMHELGHTLGLGHGGGDDINYKPNYLSIMNYAFQYDVILPGRPLDYSRKALPQLNETGLNEAAGIGEARVTVWRVPDHPTNLYGVPGFYRSDGNIAIDWNADGNISGRIFGNPNDDYADYNSPCCEKLKGYDDWSNLVYRFRGIPLSRRSAAPGDYHVELTDEQIERMAEEATSITVVIVPSSYNGTEPDRPYLGITEGDWFEYSVNWTGGPPPGYYPKRIGGDVIDASGAGDTVQVFWESRTVDDGVSSWTETIGLYEASHDLRIIPATLRIGDVIYNEEYGIVVIDGEEQSVYAGEERVTIWAVESFGAMHWDRKTGVLLQFDMDIDNLHASMRLENTNLWPNPPTITGIPNITGKEDTNLIIHLDQYVFDRDNTLEELSWTVAILDTPGQDEIDITISTEPTGSMASIVPSPEWSGPTTALFTVRDPLNLTDSQNVTITYIPVNDPPVLVETDAWSRVVEDTPLTLQLTQLVHDPDSSMDDITITMESPYITTTNGANGSVTLLYPEGVLWQSVSVTISDGENQTTTTIRIDVEPVNDPPSIIPITIALGPGEEKEIQLDAYLSDPDNFREELVINLDTSDILDITTRIDPQTHILQVSTQSNATGNYSIPISVQDPGGLIKTDYLTVMIPEPHSLTTLFLVTIIPFIALIIIRSSPTEKNLPQGELNIKDLNQ